MAEGLSNIQDVRKNALISIIVPIYNVEKYIEKCIDSIINQTYKYLQIILVDDGSTDNSGMICDIMAEKDARIVVLHKENGGLVSARKAGLKIANGQYIGFIDGDDYIEPNMYESLINALEESGADIIHSGYYSLNGSCINFKDDCLDVTGNRNELLSNILLDRGITPSIWSKVFKRDVILQSYNQVDNASNYGEDMICLVASLFVAKRIKFLDKAFYFYRIRNDSMTHIVDHNALHKELQLYSNLQSVFQRYGVVEKYNEIMNQFLLNHVVFGMERVTEDKFWINRYKCGNIQQFRYKKVVLYGAGKIGRSIYSELSRMSDIDVVLWTDKNYEKYNYQCCKVHSPELIHTKEYDVIVIAVKYLGSADKIKKELINDYNIPLHKIMWSNPIGIV